MPFVMTRAWAHLAATFVLIILALIADRAVRSQSDKLPRGRGDRDKHDNVAYRRQGIKALVMGTDGRASTSKVQVVLWTFAVFYALTFLLIWGRSLGCEDPGQEDRKLCNAAVEARAAFSALRSEGLQAEYYVLLGLPLAAALTAKALKGNDEPQPEELPPANRNGVAAGIAEVISNDGGQTDLMDFQYFAFNLLTLGFFLMEFLSAPGAGLPNIPPAFLSLSGLSVAAYTTKKTLQA